MSYAVCDLCRAPHGAGGCSGGVFAEASTLAADRAAQRAKVLDQRRVSGLHRGSWHWNRVLSRWDHIDT